MNIGNIIRSARIEAGLGLKTVEASTGILASNQSKIELGNNTAPGFDTVARLAEFYGLSLDAINSAMKNTSNAPVIAASTRKPTYIPVIEWEDIGAPAEKAANPHSKASVIASPFKCSEGSYALIVSGDGMTAPHGSMTSFREGTVIVVDPDIEATNKNFIIARAEGANNIIFKQLIFDGGSKYLRPLNPQYPTAEAEPSLEVLGVVLGSIQNMME